MLFQIRTNLFFYYRLFFIILFLLLGISGIGIVVLESYTSIDIIATETDFDKKALHTTSLVMGAPGLTVAFIMVSNARKTQLYPWPKTAIHTFRFSRQAKQS